MISGSPFSEDDLLPLSALQHLSFCERQTALIHLEQAWEENVLTMEGKHLHEKAHEGSSELRGDVLTVRSLRLRCLRLGLSGQADIVEFHKSVEEGAIALPHRRGKWSVFPVEYKRGKPKRDNCDRLQLCAQALCLEEMLGVVIPAGALFYGETRRREDVAFDDALRGEVESMAERLHKLFEAGITPPAVYLPKCESCSLMERCKPKQTGSGSQVLRWLERQLAED